MSESARKELPNSLRSPLPETRDMKNGDQGGHEPHGGRGDLEPAAPPELSHAGLVEIAANWLKRQGCNVVLTERFAGNDHRGECPDAIGWWCGDFTSALIECKTSKSDFIADALKPHRKHPAMGGARWYLAPKGLLRPLAWPNGWGLLEWDGRVVRRVIEPVPFYADRDINAEAKLLLAELRIYHAQGITYRKLATGNQATHGTSGSVPSAARKSSSQTVLPDPPKETT